MAKINCRLLPIKAHYFLFMAAMGPILPQINVFGKQLGVSPDVMGFITSILPIMYILAKPAVGFLIDYFPTMRKLIFMAIVSVMILCYAAFYFVPVVSVQKIPIRTSYNFAATNRFCDKQLSSNSNDLCLIDHQMVNCVFDCGNSSAIGFISLSNNGNTSLSNNLMLCMEITKTNASFEFGKSFCDSIECSPVTENSTSYGSCFYQTITFWSFVVVMCIGTIGFNVSNCVSDATCFDMLGDQTMKYGEQRVWGTIGFGVTALLSGIVVHVYQTDTMNGVEMIAPALIIMLVFGVFDLISIKWLKLPKFRNEGETIISKVTELLLQKPIMIFLVFATLAGILDSFIIYYMFWYLEELAEQTGHMDSIKLIEGCVVAAECLGGEILFFLISGKILKRIGYVHCLSLCFFMYFIRLGLISLITNPWWLVLIELFMQGCSYALCYTCIVAYASAVSPPGKTATVQGLVAGMDDGVGFAIGSLIGGQMYKRFGGAMSFRIFAIGALITCVAHIFLRPANRDKSNIEKQRNGQLDAVKSAVTQDELSELECLKQNGDINVVIVAKP